MPQENLEWYQWLHRHPELSWQERETTVYLRGLLEQWGIPVLDTGLDTGLCAVIEGGLPGPTVALRADIDALPVTEETGLPWASETPGKMHACGHDFHMAALLGAARLLQQQAASLPGRVKLVFQPAEESSQGAARVMETGVLEDVGAIFGLHVMPTLPKGLVGLTEGGNFAAIGRFAIQVKGKGCHAAQPHQGADPILAAAQLVQALQSVVSRNVDPMRPAVLSVTHMEAGSTWNVVPPEAFLEGTIRCFDEITQSVLDSRMEQICQGVAAASGTEITLEWTARHPGTDNSPALVALAESTARRLGMESARVLPTMLGEDFAFYQKKIPGLFITYGMEGAPLHHPSFAADPDYLDRASQLLAGLAADWLESQAK